MDRLRTQPGELSVLQAVGLGGAGKSRLLVELRREARSRGTAAHVVAVDLMSQAYSTDAGPLLRLREQVGIDCLLFDAALLTFWHTSGLPITVERSSRLSKSPVLDSLQLGGEALGVANPLSLAIDFALPVKFAVRAYEQLRLRYARIRHYQREEFEAIDELRDGSPDEVLALLPHYLGLDIRRRLEDSDDLLVAFYDTYEKQTAETVSDDAPWLRELIGTLDRGLHVIATCEPLRWSDADWGEFIQDMHVGPFPEPEAREILTLRLGHLRPEIESHLLHVSDRLPFLLETVSSSYEELSFGGRRVELDDLPSSSEDAVPRLLAHLPEEQQRVAVTVAAVQVFDEPLFRYLLHELNLRVDVFEFEPFTERYFVDEIAPGLYKTHDLLTASVRASSEHQNVRRGALDQATRHLRMRCQDTTSHEAPETALALFLALLDGWSSTSPMDEAAVELIVDAGYLIYDAGHWHELAAIAQGQAYPAGHPVALVVDFLSALVARRITGVRQAIGMFDRLTPNASSLGRHERSVRLEAAYMAELDGDYGRARSEFARLSDASSPFDPTDRTHLRARLWHADMLTMDGELQEASRLLLETYELVEREDPLHWAELVRHRAHAFRFSFIPEQAAGLYVKALQAVPNVPAMQGKIQTNFAETCCWYDPERALAAAALSSDLNLRLGSRIELGKCEAARAIALAKLGKFDAAHDAVVSANGYARAAGYRAGVAFALQAKAVVAGLDGDGDGLYAAYGDLRHEVGLLGTYKHLLVAPAWLLEGDDEFVEAAIDVDWIDAGDLENRLRACLNPADG